jgi:bacteriocin-like protein
MKDLLVMNSNSFCEVSEEELFEVEGGWNPLDAIGTAVAGELVKHAYEGARAIAEYAVGFSVGFTKAILGKGK